MKTTLGQLCTGFYDNLGALKFQIVSSIDYVLEGDLPFATIFVHQIVSSTDPKADKFLRVGTVVDLTTQPLTRDAALLSGVATYLALDFTVTFADVATATTAKALIQTCVDTLISDWIKYNNEFIIPDSIELPAASDTIVEASQAAFAAAKKAHEDAEALLVAASDAYTDAQAEATAAAAAATKQQLDCVTATTNNNLLSAGLSATATLRSLLSSTGGTLDAMQTIYGLVVATGTWDTASRAAAGAVFLTAIDALRLAVTTEAQAGAAVTAAAQSAILNQGTSICQLATTAAATKAAEDVAAATALTAQIAATAMATAAQASLETALTAVLQVCPDFDVNE